MLACLAAIGCTRVAAGSAAQPARAFALQAPTAAAAEQPVPPTVPSAADAPPSAAPALEHALITGGANGLELWAPDGSAHRVLSPGPALHPQRIADDAVLALSAEAGNLHLGAQLVRISLRDGARRRLAQLPAFACANATAEDMRILGLDVQSADDIVVDTRGRAVCLTLMDRNSNMANLQVQVRIDLDSGQVQRWLTIGEEDCTAPPGVTTGDPSDAEWCEPRQRPAPTEAPATFAFDFDADTGTVQQLSPQPAVRARLRGEYMRELASPSGRWLVLGGDLQEGDYIHRSLILCDREDGALYPVLEEPGTWPAPLKAAGRSGVVKLPADGMADVVGESDIRWLVAGDGSELLIVDTLVLLPKRASWSFEGQLAQ